MKTKTDTIQKQTEQVRSIRKEGNVKARLIGEWLSNHVLSTYLLGVASGLALAHGPIILAVFILLTAAVGLFFWTAQHPVPSKLLRTAKKQEEAAKAPDSSNPDKHGELNTGRADVPVERPSYEVMETEGEAGTEEK